MARDNEKFTYYRIGIPKDSDLSAKIEQDAKYNGMFTEIAKLLVVRIGDYYRGVSGTNVPITVETSPEQVEVVDEMEQKRKNAIASAGEWE